jgi:hypothetical protein
MRSNKIILLICTLLAASCVDRFIPVTARYDQTLFIECLIADGANLATVKISLSAPIATEESDSITYKPNGVSGAQARILCTDGKEYFCAENLPGYYTAMDFKALPGQSYKLVVNYGGNTFESDFQEMKPCPPIDSISHKPVVQKLSESGEVVDGYRFYASTHDSAEGASYYRWTLDATFIYTVPYIASHIWDGRNTTVASNKLVRTCWKSKEISGIYISKSAGLAENRVIEAPLNFESQSGDELSIRYSLNVRQYAISQSAFEFWENIQKLVSQTGSLYQTQPSRILGNIRCTTDPAVAVTGIFEFPVIPVRCLLLTVGVDIPWWRLPAGSYVTMDYQSNSFLTATPSCYDCRLRDGTLEKPPFWNDGPMQ